MAGNSQRRGATRKSSGGNPTAGSGGRRRQGLEGKGPTPRAEERPNHKAYKAKKATEKRASARPRRSSSSDGSEWVAGRNPVVELLRANVPVTAVYLADANTNDERVKEIFELTTENRVPVMEASRSDLDRLTDGAVHQGAAAKLEAYEYADPMELLDRAAQRGQAPLIVVLDQVTDPRNLGAVVRSASGFGAHGVVIAERRSASMTAAAWKTSAGAAARVPVARATNLTRQLKEYQKAGLMVIGLAADGDVDLPSLELGDGPLVVVVGSEGKGISRLVSETCDQLVSIPMTSGLESLNAGVAAGVALYAIAQSRT